MNAAFLLVTSAWLAGADAAPQFKPVPGPAVAPAAACASCGDCCDDGCGHNLLSKLRAKFHRDDCGDTCGCGHAKPAHHHESGCNTCNECGFSDRLKAKLHGWFHRDCGCDTGCGGCGAAPAKAPEQLPVQPKEVKKMPSSTTGILRPVPAVTPVSRVIISE